MVPVQNNLIEITRRTANEEWDESSLCMFDTFHLCLLDFPAEIIFNSSSEPFTRGYSKTLPRIIHPMLGEGTILSHFTFYQLTFIDF